MKNVELNGLWNKCWWWLLSLLLNKYLFGKFDFNRSSSLSMLVSVSVSLTLSLSFFFTYTWYVKAPFLLKQRLAIDKRVLLK